MTTFYIVRHGQSEGNALWDEKAKKTEASGLAGTSLTKLGKKQAETLANKLKSIYFDAIFSSTLTRAKQTAEIIAVGRKITVETTDRIRERNYYDYTENFPDKTEVEMLGEMREDLKKLDEKAKLAYKHTPSMESAEEGALRLLNFIREIAVAYSGKTILIACHGNIMRSLLTHLGYAKWDDLPSGAIENTGYFVLKTDGSDIEIGEIDKINIGLGAPRIW